MKLLWTDRSRKDLLAIRRYIARDNPETAKTWVEKLRANARRAAKAPTAGRIVPELGQAHIREVLQGNYRIVYRITRNAIEVVTVFEGHKLFSNLN